MGRRYKFYSPEKNVKYHFAFSNGKTMWLRFFEKNNKGRLVYCNVDTGYFGDMSPERFSYLYNKQLLGTKIIESEEKKSTMQTNSKVVPGVRILDDSPTDKQVQSEFEILICKLKGITDNVLINRIKEVVGRTPGYFATELLDWYKGTMPKDKHHELLVNYGKVKSLIASNQCAVLANV